MPVQLSVKVYRMGIITAKCGEQDVLTDAALLSHITEAETYRRHIGACKHTHKNKQKVLHKTVKPTKPDCICKEI